MLVLIGWRARAEIARPASHEGTAAIQRVHACPRTAPVRVRV